jgi:hypothetical protein
MDQLITSRPDESMGSQRILSMGLQIMLRI